MNEPAFELRVSLEALHGLDRLPDKIAVAIVEFVTVTLPQNPMRMSKPLVGRFAGLRSARRGDYRVLLRIHDDARLIEVVRIAHRSDVYRV